MRGAKEERTAFTRSLRSHELGETTLPFFWCTSRTPWPGDGHDRYKGIHLYKMLDVSSSAQFSDKDPLLDEIRGSWCRRRHGSGLKPFVLNLAFR